MCLWTTKWPPLLDTLISLETAVWCSALHTTNNMETGLGVAKLWVQPICALCRMLDTNSEGIREDCTKSKVGRRLALRSAGLWEEELDRSKIQWRTEMERFRWERMMWAMKGQWELHNKRRCYTGAPWNYTQRPKRRNKRISKRRLKTGAMSRNNLLFFTEYIELLILRKSNQSRNNIKQESAPRAPQVPSAPTRP